jgi:hypothetical protein
MEMTLKTVHATKPGHQMRAGGGKVAPIDARGPMPSLEAPPSDGADDIGPAETEGRADG